MPEGDAIYRAAHTLNRALAGSAVMRFESVFPALTRVDHDRPIAGRTVESVVSRGKHILMAFSGDLLLRTHMKMSGRWHLYRPGERWQRPAGDMRIVIETAQFVAVGFKIPTAEFLSTADVVRHKELDSLGPDLLSSDFDRDEALRRMRQQGHMAIGDVLLNQRVVAGVGNIFKSEVLFLTGVDPFTPTSELSDDIVGRIVDEARKQLHANVLSRSQTLSTASGIRTTRSLDPREKLWVYYRGGKPCRKCGTTIKSKKTGVDARGTWWCPQCQR